MASKRLCAEADGEEEYQDGGEEREWEEKKKYEKEEVKKFLVKAAQDYKNIGKKLDALLRQLADARTTVEMVKDKIVCQDVRAVVEEYDAELYTWENELQELKPEENNPLSRMMDGLEECDDVYCETPVVP